MAIEADEKLSECSGSQTLLVLILLKMDDSHLRNASWEEIEAKQTDPMFKTMNKRRGGFTIVELMIVVAIIALLAAFAVPSFVRSRKRSQATRILEDIRIIDSAIDQYAIDANKSAGALCDWTDVQQYLKKGSVIYNSGGYDLLGSVYVGGGTVDCITKLSATTFNKLSDVAPSDFWSPHYP